MAVGLKAITLALLPLFYNTIAKETLINGESLETGDYLEKGPYRFVMQTDCNLVLYVNPRTALWSSNTSGAGTSCQANLQNNGNLVVKSGADVIWASNTAVGPNKYRLIVQGDGNVVIYGAALWATNTVQSRKCLL